VVFILISSALFEFLLSIYLWSAPWPRCEIKAMPLDYTLGTELGLLSAEIALVFVCMVVFFVILFFALSPLLVSINPWSTRLPISQLC